MKKLAVLLFSGLIVFSFSTSAYSGPGMYMSGNIGGAVLSDIDVTVPEEGTLTLESDMGLALGIALGYDFGNNIRLEGEIAYQKNDVDKLGMLGLSLDADGDTSSLAFLLNGYYDFTNDSAFTPFISAGIGYAKVEVNDLSVPLLGQPADSDDDSEFAYQLGAGIGYAVSEKTTLDFKYRYFGTADLEFDDNTEAEYASHNFYFGIRFGF